MVDRFRVAHAVLTFSVVLALCSGASADNQFPYAAFVNTDEVYIRSGPGKNYYPTQKLQKGEQVEVYRHDPGGWFAIRPPAGSFSWLAGEYVKPGDDGLGSVIGDRVVARVGSQLSDIRDVIQVRLNRGEDVEILEAKQFNPGPAAQTWYKINPVAGEFRWIHGRFLSNESPTPAQTVAGPRKNLLVEADAREEMRDRDPRDEDYSVMHESAADRVSDAEDDETADDVQLVEHRERKSNQPGENSRRHSARDSAALSGSPEDEDLDLDHEERSQRVRIAQRDSQRGARRARSHFVDVTTELDDIDLELSAMVAEEPAEWRFDRLLARTDRALDRCETAEDRDHAVVVVEKIEKFAEIKRRMDAIGEVPARTARATRQPITAVSPTSGARAASQQFDGVGRLARVNSAKPGVPSYALTDATGAIRCFVTPAPGMNLRHYLGQEIGVTGNVGLLPEMNQQHLTARRVTVMGGQPLIR